MTYDKCNAFTRAYIDCLLWSETDGDGTAFDADYDHNDLAPEALAQIVKDCADFMESQAALLEESGMDDAQAGHDFCLTRNGHGAGFWDRGLGEVGDKLSDACEPYGTMCLYVGDDGKLYVG